MLSNLEVGEGAGADVTEKEGEYGEEWLKLY